MPSMTRTIHTATVQRLAGLSGQNFRAPHSVPSNTPELSSASMLALCELWEVLVTSLYRSWAVALAARPVATTAAATAIATNRATALRPAGRRRPNLPTAKP